MSELIRLRDLPGVGTLEWAIAERGWTDEHDEWAADLSEQLFGIAPEDTYLWQDEEGRNWLGGVEVEGSQQQLLKLASDWTKHFQVLKLFRDESDAFWSSVGWDVTDGAGKQLEVMRELGRPLVCVVKRLHVDAKLNIDQDQSVEEWGARLEQAAKLFKPTR